MVLNITKEVANMERLPDHYDDGGYTGGNMERPALKRLLADIEAGKDHESSAAGSRYPRRTTHTGSRDRRTRFAKSSPAPVNIFGI